MRSIAIIGLGYVGLPTAVIFATKGFKVIGIDIDPKKVESINEGKCYIREPNLDTLLKDVVKQGLLAATSNCREGIRTSEAVLIAVPTPVNREMVNLDYLKSALTCIKKNLKKGMLVVIESTIPPGTTIGFVKPYLEESGLHVEEDFYLAYVPERIAPGKAIEELLYAPRIVGGLGPKSTKRALELYSVVNSNLLPTDVTTAEFVKLAENTYRDVNIAFANLLALIAERFGVDVYEAIRLANTHPRVNIHWPGAGVGGPCLTKDPYMLASQLPSFWGVELIRLARRINEYMPRHLVKIVERTAELEGLELRKSKILVLGAAYKGGVNDTRESPARVVVKELMERGARVIVHDPYTRESFGAEYSDDLYDAAKGADLAVVVTDHPEFKYIDIEKLGSVMRRKILVDGRRIFDPYKAYSHGFRYYGIGFGKAWRI